jgi:predicted nucleotidyltransferase
MDGETVLSEAVEAYREALRERLLGAYALGSLAHGGFSELVSDVDLALIVSDPILPGDAATIEQVAAAEKRNGSDLHSRLSVFWGTPSTLREERSGGRFPALDRLDLIESGRLLAGSDDARRGLPRPSSAELIITGAEFALDYLAGLRAPADARGDALGSIRFAGEDALEQILSPVLLVREGVRRVTKLVLFPVRFLYTAATARVGTNDAAVERYLDDREAPSRALVAAARAWRTGAAFGALDATALLGRELVPLYLHYIEDHIARLAALDRADLVDSFSDWRARLIDRSPHDRHP